MKIKDQVIEKLIGPEGFKAYCKAHQEGLWLRITVGDPGNSVKVWYSPEDFVTYAKYSLPDATIEALPADGYVQEAEEWVQHHSRMMMHWEKTKQQRVRRVDGWNNRNPLITKK